MPEDALGSWIVVDSWKGIGSDSDIYIPLGVILLIAIADSPGRLLLLDTIIEFLKK